MGTGQDLHLLTENTDVKLEEMSGSTSHWYQMQMELLDFFIRYTETFDLPCFPGRQ